MKILIVKILVLVAVFGMQGCGPFSSPPDLKVTTLYIAPWVVPQLTILNEDERPVVVESVTVNGKYEVLHVWGRASQPSSRKPRWKQGNPSRFAWSPNGRGPSA